jgi:Sec7-like guanine-nucleotide exchange factor
MEVESNKHLLWECVETKIIWSLFNDVITEYTSEQITLNSYEDIFRWEQTPIFNVLKVKIIQQLIQIKRPKGWTKNTLTKLIMDFHNVESYIANKNEKLNDHNVRWKCFRTLLNSCNDVEKDLNKIKLT